MQWNGVFVGTGCACMRDADACSQVQYAHMLVVEVRDQV